MDDYYTECRNKVNNAADPASAIDELVGISVHDLPMVQLCKFVEQAATLISTVVQSSVCSTQERIARFQAIRQQLDMTLNYMEQILEAEKAFPCVPQTGDCWW